MLYSDDLRTIFDESLKTIERLLLEQIEHAHTSKVSIDKVVLVGGFGDSPALKGYLRAALTKFNASHRTSIRLVVAPANTGATGVATGAVMRAGNKENGPKRVPGRSIGVRRHIPPDEEAYSAEVLDQRTSLADISQQEYIKNTIWWLIKAVSITASIRTNTK